jgi:hypothetical protein
MSGYSRVRFLLLEIALHKNAAKHRYLADFARTSRVIRQAFEVASVKPCSRPVAVFRLPDTAGKWALSRHDLAHN